MLYTKRSRVEWTRSTGSRHGTLIKHLFKHKDDGIPALSHPEHLRHIKYFQDASTQRAISYIAVELQRSLGGADIFGEESGMPAEKTEGLGGDLVARQAFRSAVTNRRYQVTVWRQKKRREL